MCGSEVTSNFVSQVNPTV